MTSACCSQGTELYSKKKPPDVFYGRLSSFLDKGLSLMSKNSSSSSPLFSPIFNLPLVFICAVAYCNTVFAQTAGQPKLLIQSGHTFQINALVRSPVGDMIASGGDDFVIKLWDARQGLLLSNFAGHSGPVSSLAFSPDGRYLVSGSHDGTARLWDTVSGRFIRALPGTTSQVHSVAFSRDGKLVAAGGGWYKGVSDSSVKIWSVPDGRLLRRLEGHTDTVSCIAFSPDSRSLISGSHDGTMRFWSVSLGRQTKMFTKLYGAEQTMPSWIDYIEYGPDGKTFLIVSDRLLEIRSINTGRVLRAIGDPEISMYSVAFSPDRKLVVAGGLQGEQTLVWNVKTRRKVLAIDNSSEGATYVTFSRDGKLIFTGGNDAIIKVWNASNGALVRQLSRSPATSTSAVYSLDGSTLAWANGDTIRLWDARGGRMLHILRGHSSPVNSVAFSPDGGFLVSGSGEDGAKIWSVKTGRLVRNLGGKDLVYAVAFSPDGNTVATGSGEGNSTKNKLAVNLWDWRNGSLKRSLPIPSLYDQSGAVRFERARYRGAPIVILSIDFSPDGRLVAAGGNNRTINVWQVQGGRMIHALKGQNYGVTSVNFSPDGDTLAASGTDIKLWDVRSGSQLKQMEGHNAYINVVKFSPDGSTLASASNDRTIKIWDRSSGKIIHSIEDHYSGCNSVAYSPDGRFLVSTSNDATTRLWSVAGGEPVATIVTPDGDEWVVFTPDNYYQSSDGASQYITWRAGNFVRDASAFRPQYFKPDVVTARLLGTAPPVVVPSETAKGIPTRKSEASILSAGEATLRERWKSMRYKALVIANSVYRSNTLGTLKTPRKNGVDIEKTLREGFGFAVTPLYDATREQILNALDDYRLSLDDNDIFLIYYTGHGEYESDTGVSYWQPVDANPGRPATWISSDDVINRVRGMKARHVLIVVDSCFSGGFFGPRLSGPMLNEEPLIYLDQKMEKSSRLLMTSGGLDFIDDAGENGRTLFTNAFIRGLQSAESNIFTAEQLYDRHIRNYVINNSKIKQEPRFGPIPNSARMGSTVENGNFVFVRRQ